jgi:TerC family integral membrane protein
VTANLVGWVVFGVLVLGLLALDLGLGRKRTQAVPLREALAWSAMWVLVAVLFGIAIYDRSGPVRALEYFTGYVVELSLSADNVFVFLLLFTYFRVPPQHQHRVLFWGILGALVMRGLFIAAGVALIQRFHVVVYLFGGLLVVSGVKMALQGDTEVHPERNPVLRLARRFLPVTRDFVGGRFFTGETGRLLATPLFVVLLMVETSDLLFAVDSIPAVLAITRDPFVVYTSNIFAILGLRSLYFALAGFLDLFHYLSHGLSAILVLVGAKMLLSDVVTVPTHLSLAVIAVILAGSVIASILRPKPKPASPAGGSPGSAP